MLLAACQAHEVAYGVIGQPSHSFRELFAASRGPDGTSQAFAQAIKQVRARIDPVFSKIKKAKGDPLLAPTWIPQAEGPIEQRIADFLTPAAKPGVPDTTPPPPAPTPVPVWQQQSGDIALAPH